jgi:hypothetical protein
MVPPLASTVALADALISAAMGDLPGRAGLARDGRLLGACALAAALLTVAFIVLAGGGAPATEPGELLAYFHAHRGRYVASAVVVLAWMVAALAAIAVMPEWVGEGRRALARAATLLCAAGIVLLGFGSFAGIGAFFALDDAAGGIAARLQSPYQAAFWRNMGFLLSDPGLMALGAGQLLLAWLALATGLSRIVVTIGFVGGACGLLTLAVYQTPMLAIAQMAAFAVWAAAAGIASWRAGAEATDPPRR